MDIKPKQVQIDRLNCTKICFILLKLLSVHHQKYIRTPN